MTDPIATRIDERYARIMGRLTATMLACAMVIHAPTALYVRDNPRSLLWTSGCVLFAAPFDAWASSVLLKKWGAFAAELARMVVNLTLSLVQAHQIGWPLPVHLTFESEVGRGTTFTIRLPTAPKRKAHEQGGLSQGRLRLMAWSLVSSS